MKCGECGGELKESVEVVNGVQVRTYTCEKCEKVLQDYHDKLKAQRVKISKEREEKFKGITNKKKRMDARRGLTK